MWGLGPTQQISQSALGLGQFPSHQSVLLSTQDCHSESPGQRWKGRVKGHCLHEGGSCEVSRGRISNGRGCPQFPRDPFSHNKRQSPLATLAPLFSLVMSRICKLQRNKVNYQLSLCPGSSARRTGTEGKARERVGERESLKETSQYIRLEISPALQALPGSSPPSHPGPNSGPVTSPSERRMNELGRGGGVPWQGQITGVGSWCLS